MYNFHTSPHMNAPSLLLCALMVIFGLSNCFWGHKFFKMLIGVWGFLAGATGGIWMSIQFGIYGIWKLLVVIIGGILGTTLVMMVFYAGVFLFGALLGYFIALILLEAWPRWPELLVAGGLAILGGLVAISIQRPLLVLTTAYAGSWIAISAVTSLLWGHSFGRMPPVPNDIPRNMLSIFIVWIILGTLGMAYQFGLTGGKLLKSG